VSDHNGLLRVYHSDFLRGFAIQVMGGRLDDLASVDKGEPAGWTNRRLAIVGHRKH
jgi:hypothetical protein